MKNLIRHTLPTIVNLILEDDSVDFGMRLLRALIEFVRRLLLILVVCVGPTVALKFIGEMTDIGIPEPSAPERTAIVAFKKHIVAAARRQFDIQHSDTSDVTEFLVIRLPQAPADVPPLQAPPPPSSTQQTAVGEAAAIIAAAAAAADNDNNTEEVCDYVSQA